MEASVTAVQGSGIRGVKFVITAGMMTWEGEITDDPSVMPEMFRVSPELQPRLLVQPDGHRLFLPRGHGFATVSLDLVDEAVADPGYRVGDDGWTFLLEHLKVISILMGGVLWKFLMVRS
ncbi:MAG: hypothetical protein Q7N87_00555 [Candidatus Uhrbacteria bacterium]|nr:hypothetical protein [Candidatus Uhrbacteria bacterium]MDP3793668.1 hypothetical protein [Candidatus Uhrbacteria bacterium]